MAASRGRPFRVRGTERRRGAVAGKPRAPRAPLLWRGAALVALEARAPSRRDGARPAAPRRSDSGDLELRPGGGAKAEQCGVEGAGDGGEPSFLLPRRIQAPASPPPSLPRAPVPYSLRPLPLPEASLELQGASSLPHCRPPRHASARCPRRLRRPSRTRPRGAQQAQQDGGLHVRSSSGGGGEVAAGGRHGEAEGEGGRMEREMTCGTRSKGTLIFLLFPISYPVRKYNF
ncbi:hypothetical protein PVAP13_5KG488007 [Panicum virgatum]|uniref:Uncharacterized protein n=1 Tax=Panicum virgatum TaxID=38727 RepID=A0A8T0SKC8_PANVG|nr:hypothetical protein PVAP13_5KG488007 [Panicum virgatum]